MRKFWVRLKFFVIFIGVSVVVPVFLVEWIGYLADELFDTNLEKIRVLGGVSVLMVVLLLLVALILFWLVRMVRSEMRERDMSFDEYAPHFLKLKSGDD